MPTIKPANFPVLNPDSIRSPHGNSRPAENSQPVISNPGTTDKLVKTSEAEQSRKNRLLFYHPNKSKLKQPQPLGKFIDIKI